MVWKASYPEGNEDVVRTTPVNLCNHAYWNLSGDFKDATVAEHGLALNCDKIIEIDDGLTPTGVILDVQDTPFDFREEKIPEDVEQFTPQPPKLVGDEERLSGAI